ncbi:unnamed protein product [Closterium sp. Yama58-4]|nr:unnamed protein product [Closterium sp. Yama58-4]
MSPATPRLCSVYPSAQVANAAVLIHAPLSAALPCAPLGSVSIARQVATAGPPGSAGGLLPALPHGAAACTSPRRCCLHFPTALLPALPHGAAACTSPRRCCLHFPTALLPALPHGAAACTSPRRCCLHFPTALLPALPHGAAACTSPRRCCLHFPTALLPALPHGAAACTSPRRCCLHFPTHSTACGPPPVALLHGAAACSPLALSLLTQVPSGAPTHSPPSRAGAVTGGGQAGGGGGVAAVRHCVLARARPACARGGVGVGAAPRGGAGSGVPRPAPARPGAAPRRLQPRHREEQEAQQGGQKRGGDSGGGGGQEERVLVAGRVAGYLHVNPLFIASLLEEASSLFASAGLHSFAVHLQELLLPFWKAHGNFSAASRCHRRLAASYLLLTQRPGGGGEEGVREGGPQQWHESCVQGASFFLVAFYGERFGPAFNGRQFVYKEPRGTSAGELVRRLRSIYDGILGSSTSLRIITSPILTPNHLRHSQLCTVQGEEGLRAGKEGAMRGDLDELFGGSGGGRGPVSAFQVSMPPSALAAAAAAAIEGLVDGGGEGGVGGGAGGEDVMGLLELGYGGAGGMGYGMGSGGTGDASCEIASDFTSGSALGRGAVFPVWRHRMVLTVHPRFPSLQLHLPVVGTHTVEASPLDLVLDESRQWTRRLSQLVATWRAKTGRSLEEDGTKTGDVACAAAGGGGQPGCHGRGAGAAAAALPQGTPCWGGGGRRGGVVGRGEGAGEIGGAVEAGETRAGTGTGDDTGAGGRGEAGRAGEGRRGGSRWAEGLASWHVARAMGEVVEAAEAAREGVEGVGKPMAPLLAWLEDAADATPPETLAALARYGLLDGGNGGDAMRGGAGVEVAREREQREAEREIAAVAALAAAAAAGGEEAVRVGKALTDYVEALSAVVQAHERRWGGDDDAHEEVKARAKGMMEELYLYVPGIRPWSLV